MRILLISNNPLSKSGSNGRTMLNMLEKFKKNEILNIFINGNNVSLNSAFFYRLNESSIVKNKKPYGFYFKKENNSVFSTKSSFKKKVFKYLIRSFVWSKKSIKKELLNVALNFKPDKIIIQCGDSDFLINISCWLSCELNIPIISYNSEDYIFKTWNYIEKKNHRSLIFKIYMKRLQKSYGLLYKRATSFVYLTDSLKNLYLSKYPNHNAFIVYNSSNLDHISQYNKNGDIVYCGNVGVGRDKTLISLSKEIYAHLHKKIKVYSQISEASLFNSLRNCDTLEYVGNVSYSECINIQKKASFLLLVESFDDYYLRDTKNAFSTKIADSLSLGVPLVALIPKSSFVYKYLHDNECAIIGSSISCLINQILSCDENQLRLFIQNAINVAAINHNSNLNSNKFYQIISGEKHG